MVAAAKGRPPQFLRRVHNRPAVRRRSSALVLLQLLLVASGLGIGGGLAWGAYRWIHDTDTFRLERLILDGVPSPLRARVREALQPIDGANLLLLDTEQVTLWVRAIPQVEAARVRRLLPDALEVEVDARPPWGIVVGSDVSLLLARDGTVLGPASTQRAELPVLQIEGPLGGSSDRARLPASVPGTAFFADAVEVLDWLAAGTATAFGPVHHLRLDADGVVIVRADVPWEIVVGDSRDLEVKAENLMALLHEDIPPGGVVVDLRYRDMIVVRAAEETAARALSTAPAGRE